MLDLGTSSSGPKQTTNTAQDTGRVLYGKAARYTESGSFQTGDKSTFTESGGINVGAKGTLKTGTDLSGAKIEKGSTVNIGEVGLGTTFAQTVKDLFSSQADAIGRVNGSPALPVDAPPGDVTGEDGTETGAGSKLKWVLVVGVLGLIWWWWRK